MILSYLYHISDRIHIFWQWILNILFPPRCLACLTWIDTSGALCANCWGQMEFVHKPACMQCGHPFEFTATDNTLCGACIAHPPPYRQARAVCIYNDVSRKIITGLKYGDRTHIAPYIGQWMARNGKDLLQQADVIVPVPLHRFRLFARRYNQAALLAYAIQKHIPTPVLPRLLRRKHYTPPQAGLTRIQRQKNVSDAFTTEPHLTGQIKQKRIVLIDDVMTTGATIHACSRALLKAGATHVDVLTFCRTRHDN